jgi:glycosyltransferase involved in cell wall biosynthesis
VTFLGPLSNDAIRDEYRRALAFILPGEEDFGIAPLEAQACGRPVVALARGGALETVVDGETGVLFDQLAADSLAAALQRVAALRVDGDRVRAHAERFSRERHIAEMRQTIAETIAAPAGTTW